MLFKKRNRAYIDARAGCDCCNSNLSPFNIRKERRRMKRREKTNWRKEVSRDGNEDADAAV